MSREDGGVVAAFSGPCSGCGTEREFAFRQIPHQGGRPPGDGRWFGRPAPSQLLDAGEWLYVADTHAAEVIAGEDAPTPDVGDELSVAIGAIDEVLNFVPEGADAVPAEAFRSERGRSFYAADPARFQVAKLRGARTTYQDLLVQLRLPGKTVLSPDEVRGVFSRLQKAWGYVGSPATQDALRILGWSEQPADGANGAADQGPDGGAGAGGPTHRLVAATGLPTRTGTIQLDGGQISRITVDATDPVPAGSVPADAFLEEAFTLACRAAAQDLGQPDERLPAPGKQQRWRREDVWLVIRKGSTAVELSLEMMGDERPREIVDDEQGWGDFHRRLTRVLSDLVVDQFVVIAKAEAPLHYVQAIRFPEMLHAEAASNQFLEGQLRLTTDGERKLAAAGWRPPGGDAFENWWMRLSGQTTPGDHERMAAMMVTALREVYLVATPVQLVYRSFQNGPGAGPRELPELGVARESDSAEADPESGRSAPPPGPATAPDPSLGRRVAGPRPDQRVAGPPPATPPAAPSDQRVAGPPGPPPEQPIAGPPGPPPPPYQAGEGPAGSPPGADVPPAFPPPGPAVPPATPPAFPPPHGAESSPAAPAFPPPHGPESPPTPPAPSALPAFPPPNPPIPERDAAGDHGPQTPPPGPEGHRPPGPLGHEVPGSYPGIPGTNGPASGPMGPPAPGFPPEPAPPAPPAPPGRVPGHPGAEGPPPGPSEAPGYGYPQAPPTGPSGPSHGIPGSEPQWPPATGPQGQEPPGHAPAGPDPTSPYIAGPPGPQEAHPTPPPVPPPPVTPPVTPPPAAPPPIPPPQPASPLPGEVPYPAGASGPAPSQSAGPTVGGLVPDPTAGGELRPEPNRSDLDAMVMQKVLAHDHVVAYLERGYDMVSGFVHRLKDVAHLRTPEQLMRSLGLTYEATPFNERDEAVHVLRWRIYTVGLYRTPLGGPTPEVMRSVPGGWVIERPPFGGTGYAPSFGEVIPEFKADSHRLPHLTEMYRIDRSGDARFVAVYNADEQRWIPASA